MPVTVSVVLFDLDDTLFAHQHAVASGVLAHRAAHRLPGDASAELTRWHDLEEHHYHRYLSGELDFLDQRRARARAFVEPYGIDLATDLAADDWFDRYLAEYRRAWRLHDDALPCLDELERRIAGVRFGVITNGDIAFQTEKLVGVALAERIEHVVASGTVGVAKPDARIFQVACEVFGVEPGEAIYIGDRLHTDAIGAAGAGLGGVWIDREGLATDDELAAARDAGVRVIRSLAELPALLTPTANS